MTKKRRKQEQREKKKFEVSDNKRPIMVITVPEIKEFLTAHFNNLSLFFDFDMKLPIGVDYDNLPEILIVDDSECKSRLTKSRFWTRCYRCGRLVPSVEGRHFQATECSKCMYKIREGKYSVHKA